MKKKPANKLLLLICAIFFLGLSHGIVNTVTAQSQNLGDYKVQLLPDWIYSNDKSSGDFYVFLNSQQKIEVAFKKEPAPCLNPMEITKVILPIIQNFQKEQWIIEQRKPAAPYSFAGQKTCHFMKLKTRGTGQMKFILNPLVKTKMYQIEITSESLLNDPPPESLYFISQVSTSDSPAIAGKTNSTQSTTDVNDPNIATSVSAETNTSDDDLSGFTKVKAPPPAPQKPKPTISSVMPEAQTPKSETNSSKSASTQAGVSTTLQAAAKSPVIEKGNIPDVKFSATDPCSPSNSNDGLPWEDEKESKIIIPKGLDTTIPHPISGLENLSDAGYRSAVSAAFEAMNLVYGEMTEKEEKEFQAAWAPLFDFPAQEVIDYLNKINPIASQFLICREAYARNFAAVNMVLLDAATAIEFDEQQAWEAAMSEANMYNSSLPPLETAMKQLIKKLEVLGNPPSPIDLKCEARKRYKRMLSNEEYPFEGEWQSEDGKEFLLKVGYKYNDGKVLVYWFPISWLNEMEAKGYNINEIGMQNNDKGDLGIIPGMFDLLKVMEEIEPGLWVSYHFAMDRTMFIYRPQNDQMEVHEYHPSSSWSPNIVLKNYVAYKKNKERNPPPVLPFKDDGEKSTWDELVKVLPKDNWSGNKILGYNGLKKDYFTSDFDIALNGFDNKRDEYKEKKAQIEGNSNLSEQEKAKAINQLKIEYADFIDEVPPKVIKQKPEVPKSNNTSITTSNEEQHNKDAIAQHTEMVEIIKHNLDREVKEQNDVLKSLSQSKSPKEADEHSRRLNELNLRIIGLQSEIQSEQDLVTSYQTGQLVHTRTAFDNYAQYKFINGIKEEVANIEATRRISERIERQIKLLPEEQQAKARELARTTLDGKTIASGDIVKAKKMVDAFGKQIEGYAGYDYAQAKEEEAYAEIKEQSAQAGIMIVGIGAVGLGSAALVEAYGAEAAAAIYGPKLLGAIYSGTTGLIRGGPKEGMSQALMGWSPNGYAVSQFIEGYQQAGQKEGATTNSQAWEGAKQAGYAWISGKVFELGISNLSKGLLAWRGPNSRLFKPVIKTSTQKSRQLQDALRSKQQELGAKDIVQTFEKMENQLVTLKMDEVKNAVKIGQMEDELQQLTSSMNASYNAKWHFKYKASPGTMRAFDRRVQKNYANMEPGMIQRMDAMGYKMDRIEFKQFRNAGSGGTSSMDLDLVPVRLGSKEPKTIFMKKDGTMVSAKEFMDDCQKTMDAEYKQLTGITAKSSDMNLVTSAHEEAFATSKLLDKKIDMSSFTDDEIKSIGDVLTVKMDGIDKNKMMTNTYKLQAKCRESSKEIDNMLLRKLKSDLQNAPAGSAQSKEIQNKIAYWEKIGKSIKQIGMEDSDPMQIIEQSNKIRRETGGRDVNGVIDDLINAFKPK